MEGLSGVQATPELETETRENTGFWFVRGFMLD